MRFAPRFVLLASMLGSVLACEVCDDGTLLNPGNGILGCWYTANWGANNQVPNANWSHGSCHVNCACMN